MARLVRVMFEVWVSDGDDLDCLGDALQAIDSLGLSDLEWCEAESPFELRARSGEGCDIACTAEVLGEP